MWFESRSGKTPYMNVPTQTTTAGKEVGDSMVKFGEIMKNKDKNDASIEAMKKLYGGEGGVLNGWSDDEIKSLGDGSALEKAIKTKDEALAKKNLIAGYRIKHPKFSKDLDNEQLYQYIQYAGKSIKDPTNGKVIDVHTDKDNKRYASVRKPDGTIVNEYLGEVKDYSQKASEPNIDLTVDGPLSQKLQKKSNERKIARMNIDDSEL